MDQDPLLIIAPTPIRRWFGIGALVGLGLTMIWTGATAPNAPNLAATVLMVLGIAAVAAAEIMRRATAFHIVLTDNGVWDSRGIEIARLDEIEAVSRGAFAMKPSNGMTLKLRTQKGRVWMPGLWWRVGRRVGIGGVTAAAEAKLAAEIIQTRIPPRDLP